MRLAYKLLEVFIFLLKFLVDKGKYFSFYDLWFVELFCLNDKVNLLFGRSIVIFYVKLRRNFRGGVLEEFFYNVFYI